MNNPKTILDAGCGLGYTTAVIAESFPEAQVLGVDLAEDAITYAKDHHANASFDVVALDPSCERIGTFDSIFCFEIYPFSRNRDVLFQSELIKICLEICRLAEKSLSAKHGRTKMRYHRF